jgi:hypothetical protein
MFVPGGGARLRAPFTLALPAEPALLDRLLTELALQADPPISVGRSATAVLAFDCDTWDGMLRSRVVQALEAAFWAPTGSRSRVPRRPKRQAQLTRREAVATLEYPS